MKPYEYSIITGGIQHANFLPFIGAALGGLATVATGAASLAGGAVSALASGAGALASGAGYLGSTAIGAGGTVLGGIGSLGTGIIDTTVGTLAGVGTALFGGQPAVPVMTGGEMGSLAYATESGGLFSNLSWDTLGNVAQAGYSLYSSERDRDLVEKAIEAQRKVGYVVSPGQAPVTSLAPTTSIAIPAAMAAKKELDTKVMIKYAIYALIAYLLFKGFK